jgi:hypothetical protein
MRSIFEPDDFHPVVVRSFNSIAGCRGQREAQGKQD